MFGLSFDHRSCCLRTLLEDLTSLAIISPSYLAATMSPQLDNPGKPLLYIQGRWLLIIGPQGLTMPCLAHLHPVVHGSKDSRAGGLLDTRNGDGMGSYRPEVKVLFRHLDEPIDT